MIWSDYVYRRGPGVEELWDQIFAAKREANRPVRLLYVTGRGFDVRANSVIERFVDRLKDSKCEVASAHLLLVGFSGYQLSSELLAQTRMNEAQMLASFEGIGTSQIVTIGGAIGDEDDVNSNIALRGCANEVLTALNDQTEIIWTSAPYPA